MTPEALAAMSPEAKRELLRRLLDERARETTRVAAEKKDDAFQLAHTQRAIWFLQRLLPETHAYNVTFSGRFSPPLNLNAFRAAMDRLVARHDALRMVFSEQDGQPVQRVLSVAEARLGVVDASNLSDAELYTTVCEESHVPFSLDVPLIATTIYRRNDEDILLINVHHLVFDAWSQHILFSDLRALYIAELNDASIELPDAEAQYRDFVMEQAVDLDGRHGDELWNYWHSVFDTDPAPLAIRARVEAQNALTMQGASVPFSLDSQASAALNALAKQQNTTLYTIMLAAMQVLLFQYSGQQDVTIGTPVSLRTRSEWLQVIGYFINLLPMRTTIDPTAPFTGHLARARETVLGALEHQEFPFPLMVSRLKLGRDPNHSPIFQAMLNVIITPKANELASLFTASHRTALQFGGSRLTSYVIPQQEGQFEIVIEVTDSDGVLHGNLKYQTDLYSRETAQRMTDSFLAILEAAVEKPDMSVDDLTRLDRDTFDI